MTEPYVEQRAERDAPLRPAELPATVEYADVIKALTLLCPGADPAHITLFAVTHNGAQIGYAEPHPAGGGYRVHTWDVPVSHLGGQ